MIVLYIYEIFPDIETNGVDIYGGWEGSEGQIDIRDTADPIVIARYWLIRFVEIFCCEYLLIIHLFSKLFVYSQFLSSLSPPPLLNTLMNFT